MIPDILRTLLFAYAFAALVIALFYLRRRRLTLGELAFWGTIALALPVFGPFFVIVSRPGPGPRVRARKSVLRRS